MTDIVYVAGLMRSGSTLLDLILGSHSRYIGLGEVYELLSNSNNYLKSSDSIWCSCKRILNECEFWSPILKTLNENVDISLPEKYQIVLSEFRNQFGQSYILVDSSKSIKGLNAWLSLSHIKLKVLYIMRDVRSWTISSIDARRRFEDYFIKDLLKKYKLKGIEKYIKRTTIKFFLQWYIQNNNIQNYLTNNNISFYKFSYEEMCLYPELIFESIFEYLNVDIEDDMFKFDNTKSHVAVGNRLRVQTKKRKEILYDNRWFFRSELYFASLFLYPIMRYNSREVYSNTLKNIWQK